MSASASRSLTSSDRGDTRSLRLEELLNPKDDTVSHTKTCQQSERTSRGETPSMTTGSVTGHLSTGLPHVRTYPRPASPEMTSRSPSTCIANFVTRSLPSGIDSQRFVLPRDYANIDNAPDTLGLPKVTTGRPVSSRSSVLTTSVARMSSSCQMGQRARESQVENCNRPGDLNLMLPHPVQGDHYGTPVHVEATASNITYQPHSHFPMLPSSGPSSTMPQIGVETTKAQYSMMTWGMEQGIQIPVDTQAGSKVANEKRKRGAEACSRARKKRKDEKQNSAARIAALETHIFEVTEEIQQYRKERDDLKDMVLRHHGPCGPRPPSPNPRWHVTLNEASPAHY